MSWWLVIITNNYLLQDTKNDLVRNALEMFICHVVLHAQRFSSAAISAPINAQRNASVGVLVAVHASMLSVETNAAIFASHVSSHANGSALTKSSYHSFQCRVISQDVLFLSDARSFAVSLVTEKHATNDVWRSFNANIEYVHYFVRWLIVTSSFSVLVSVASFVLHALLVRINS